MKPIEYLKSFLEDFKTNYTIYNGIKTSIGFTPNLMELKNMNDLPLILIEEIEYRNNTNSIIQNVGDLSFSMLYLDQVTYDNGYEVLENTFITDFNEYLSQNCNDINILSMSYNTDEDNMYGVTYKISKTFEIS